MSTASKTLVWEKKNVPLQLKPFYKSHSETARPCRTKKGTNGYAAHHSQPKMGGASGYINGRFAATSQVSSKKRLRSAPQHGQERSTRSISQGTEVTIVTE